MLERPTTTWLPNVLGVAAALLAIDALRELLVTPREQAQFFLFGVLVEGAAAWLSATLHMVFLIWLAQGCFGRRAVAVWGVLAYCGYWIVTIWVWSQTYAPQTLGTRIITNSLFTAILLAIARIVLLRRGQFDR